MKTSTILCLTLLSLTFAATCALLEVPLHVGRVDARHAPGESPEDAARRARYVTLSELARAHGLTSYDAAYLDLALRRELPLASLDDALRQAATSLGIQILGK